MFELQSRYAISIRVGFFALLILSLLAGSILIVKDKTNLLAPKYPLKIYFYKVKDLKPGTPVHLAGLPIGHIHRIEFSPKVEEYQFIVTALINKRVQDRIRKDSVAYLESSGVLGEKYIEISLGSVEQPVVPENGVIQSKH
ncbi:MCE family protein [bacterium]|nr:MCE family protein [bacterium]